MEGVRPQGDGGSLTSSIPGLRDFEGALALLTTLPLRFPDVRDASFGRMAMLFPVVGVLLGGLLAALDRFAFERLPPAAAAVLLVVIWGLLTQRRDGLHAGGVVLSILLLGAKTTVLWTLCVPRSLPLLFAPLLGCWSMVVLAVGARDAGAPQRKLAPAVMFNEFALASVLTFAILFALAEGLGVLIAVQAAAVTLLLRVHAHARAGGMSWQTVKLGASLVEATTLGLLAALSSCR